jgi:hypothetical protein
MTPMALVRVRTRVGLALAAAAVAVAGAVALAVWQPDRPEVLAPPPERPPGLADLWAGRASLVLDRKWTSTSLGMPGGGGYAGAHVEVVGDRWYLFNRRTDPGTCPGKGAGTSPMATLVRASEDGGRTWGAPAPAIAPTPGTPWECAATDGDATFDPKAGIWRYLFQCMGPASGWHGCYAERKAADPVGPFEAPAGVNPVIAPGALWNRICDDPKEDRCARHAGPTAVSQEGTFNVFDRDDGSWWVGFHGYDGKYGYRGLARTTSFRRDDWKVGGEDGTPADAIMDAGDATGWRETWRDGGPVGPGAASVLKEGGAYYQLVEVPDVDLACSPGQNWDLGLLRTTDLASTRWEQFPGGNPIVYSSRQPGADGQSAMCNVEYPSLFKDAGGVTYLMHGRISSDPANDGIYVYRLEWDRNLLRNGTLWRADGEGWSALPGTGAQMSVERYPDGAPDGTPWLAVGCGSTGCDGRQAVFQDIRVDPGDAGAELAFGGTFRIDQGEGRVQLGLLQLDESGAVVDATAVPVTAGAAYAQVRGRFTIDDRARRLRLQIVPLTPGRFGVDNLYVIPQAGCAAPRFPAC